MRLTEVTLLEEVMSAKGFWYSQPKWRKLSIRQAEEIGWILSLNVEVNMGVKNPNLKAYLTSKRYFPRLINQPASANNDVLVYYFRTIPWMSTVYLGELA